jgi:ssDNA-binding replication factor A large subunit
MKINELKVGKVDELTAEVVSIDSAKEITTKFGKNAKVAKAVIKDETGRFDLSLWNEEIKNIAIGDKIKITNGWVSEYNGVMSVSAGKYGKMFILNQTGLGV